MNFAPILPEVILGLGAVALMMVAAFVRRSSTITHVAAIALLVGACFALIGAPQTAGSVFDGMWAADGFAAFGKVIIYLSAAVAIVMAHGWFDQNHEHGAEYAVLILLSALGASVMVSATDLMMLYVGLELQSLSAYVLASYRRHDERSAEAGLKYFVLGGLASGILLYGISLLYGFAGTTYFDGIAAAFAGPNGASLGLLFGLVFTLAGIAFKIAAVPFHMWTPDVYEGAPTPVTAFFAAGQKAAAILLATRVCLDAMGPVTDQWRQIVIFAALASIMLGAVAAYGQTNIKRLLAYSSINNVGFALVGLAAGGREGATAVLVYSAVYVVMTLGAFLCVMRMRDADGRPLEKPRQPVGPVADPAVAGAGDRDVHVQPCRHSAAVRLLAQADGVLRPRSNAGLQCGWRWLRPSLTVVGAYLLPQGHQDHVFRRPGRSLRAGARQGRNGPDRRSAR